MVNIGTAAVISEATVNEWGELTLKHHTDAMGLLDARWSTRGTAWLCSSQYYWSVMQRLLTEAGGNTIASLQGGIGDATFLGVPVVFSSQMPLAEADSTNMAYFGSFDSTTMIGDRVGIRIAQSSDFAFDTDRLAIRATTRYDIQNHELGDGSNVGSITAVATTT